MKNPLKGLVNGFIRLWSNSPSRTVSEYPELYHKNPRLDPVRKIAKAAAAVDYRLYNKTDLRKDPESADPIDEHEIYELLENPCPNYPELDGYSLRYLTFAFVDLVGEFFWWKVRANDSRGTIIALNPVIPAWVISRPTASARYFTIYPYGVVGGSGIKIPQEDMVWFKDPSLTDPYANGRGASESIIDEVETDENAAKYQKAFFKNDCTPSLVITQSGGNETSAKQIKQSWMSKMAGVFHAREPVVLTGKDAKIEKLNHSMVEVDMIETRKYLRNESLQHYQIPPEIYGIIENSNRATIDAAFYLFNKNVLSDRLGFFARVVNIQLIQMDFDQNLCMKHESIVQEDDEFALKVYDTGVNKGLVTRNEWRTRFGLPEVSGGDVFLMPINVMEMPIGGIPKQELVEEEEKPDPNEIVLEIEDDEQEKSLFIAEQKTAEEIEQRKDKIWKMFDAKALAEEPIYKEIIKDYAATQEEEVKTAVKTAVKADQSEKAIDKALDSIFGKSENEKLKTDLTPAWMSSMKAGEKQAFEVLGTQKSIKADDPIIQNPFFAKWVELWGLKKAGEINDTTHTGLRLNLTNVLVEGIENGLSLGNLIKGLMEVTEGVYDKMTKYRAEMIARTESACTMNFGTFSTYKAEGVEKKEWLSTRDDRTRGTDPDDKFNHVVMQGVIVGIDEKFDVSGDSMDFPGDPAGSAGNVINCRCTISPVIE